MTTEETRLAEMRTAVRDVQLSAFPDHAPDRPVGRIVASVQTGTNADLIAKIAPLYLTGSVLDVTYGEGKWWERFTPDPFTHHDKFKGDGVDFTDLPHGDGSFDAVCFDPPYVLTGGESSTELGSFQDRFGIGQRNLRREGGDASHGGFYGLIEDGLAECCRVSRRWVLVKCMEFAQGKVGGRTAFHDVPTRITNSAAALGWVKWDQIVHHAGSGPGGHNIFEPIRARRHHSYLLVFAKKAAS